MTLQRPVVAQLGLRVGLTYKVRLAPTLAPSALTTGLFAVSSVLRVGCDFSFVVSGVALRGGRIATLSPYPRSGQPVGRAGRCAAALALVESTWGTGELLRSRPSAGSFNLGDGQGALLLPCLGAVAIGFAVPMLLAVRCSFGRCVGAVGVLNTLLCVWGIVSAGCVARRSFD